jgi:2-polyprenyl-3-methyl-5-hydroxy-6-metoxy-1,4-benzoquinol methylase
VCPEFATGNFENHRKVYEFAAQFAPDARVLDVGCGTGYGAALLADTGAASVTGIDNSEEAIGYARRKFRMDGLSFRPMDAQRLEFPGGAFDLVVSSENLEHVDDARASVSEIRRVLRSGGIFLLGTPNKEMFSPGRDRPVNRYHVKEFYFEELRELLAEFFSTVLIIENTLESKLELGRELHADRLQRGAIGLRVGESTQLDFAGRTVDLRHLHNTHSFMALAR